MKSKFLQVRKMLLVAAGLLVGASAWAEETEVKATLEHTAGAKWGSGYDGTYESTVDAALEFYNTSTTSSTYRGAAYAKFSYEIPAGHSILSATLTYNIEQSGNSSTGYPQKIFVMQEGFDLDWDTFAGQKNVDLSNSSSRGSMISEASTGGKGTVKGLTVDATAAVQTLHEAGQDYILFQWTDNNGAANLYGKGATDETLKPTLVITTTTAQAYTITFKEKNGVAVSITGDGFVVNNGTATLVDGPYKYTATASGYQDYNGTFTVDGSDQTVEFEMTAKTAVSSITVNYTYNNSIIASEKQKNIDGLYVGEQYNVPFRKYVMKDGNLYEATKNSTNPWYGESTKLTEETTIERTVKLVNVGGVVELFEDFDGATDNNTDIRASYCSSLNNSAYTSENELPAGVYTFMVDAQNRDRGSYIKVGEQTVVSLAGNEYTKNSWESKVISDVVVSEAGKLSLATTGSAIDYYDIIIAIRQTVSTSITDASWATLYSDKALDFSEVEGLTAYTATCDGETVTLTEVKDVPANTGVVLKGDVDTYSIPVIASSETTPGDLKGSATEALTYNKDAEKDYYMLALNDDNEAQFTKLIEGSIAAGKAYLELSKTAEARVLSVVFAGETTGIAEVEKAGAENGAVYNLNGQRVSKPANGLYIVNGKKVVLK